jgi:phosphoglycerate dehydrogenase-like enzyme
MNHSPSSARILTVWPDIAADLFAPVETALVDMGHRVTRYTDTDKLGADVRSLAAADVIYAVGRFRLDRLLLSAAPRLRLIVSPITGVEGFDIEAATHLGIAVANGQIAENYESMAEATILLILTCLYDLHGLERQMREGGPWRSPPSSRMLKGKTVGLIGFGHIARAVAHRLHQWDTTLLTYTPRLRSPLPEHVRRADLDELLCESDVICVLATLNAETHHLLNEERLSLTRPGCSLVNVARGSIIDEQALIRMAQRGHFRRLALDTFETEPLPADSILRDLPNVVITPHAIGHTIETHERLAEAALKNILCALRGEAPALLCNPAVLPSWERRWGASPAAQGPPSST